MNKILVFFFKELSYSAILPLELHHSFLQGIYLPWILMHSRPGPTHESLMHNLLPYRWQRDGTWYDHGFFALAPQCPHPVLTSSVLSHVYYNNNNKIYIISLFLTVVREVTLLTIILHFQCNVDKFLIKLYFSYY